MKDCFEMSSTCLTGGYPQPMREFPMMNIGVPSPQMNWQYSQMYQSKTTSPPERRDSGVNVSSPSSDDSERYTTPTMLHSPKTRYAYPNNYHQNSNILNSPSYSSPNIPFKVKEESHASEDERQDTTGSPQNTVFPNDTNALKNLEASVEKNLNISTSPEPDYRLSENNNEDFSNMEEYGVPTVNSHGKVKTVKCKQCQIIFKTKLEFWTHQRTHIKPDKLLQCKKCPFVTEYKHHLEYHLRNHGGEKPFQCQECDYKCVNKSMLNSHMKSHSNVYQYRCSSCHYSSKYCHSLKLHLRKYNHQPAMVLNPDGTPNPLPIIDVYGTRRGPKLKTTNGEEEVTVPSPKRTRTENSLSSMHSLPAALQRVHGMMPLPLMSQDPSMQFKLMMQQAFLMQTIQNMQMFQNSNPALLNSPSSISDESAKLSLVECPKDSNDSALDLSKDKSASSDESEKAKSNQGSPATSDDEDDETMNLLYNVKVEHDVDDTPVEPSENIPTTPSVTPRSPQPTTEESLRCPHCCITFDDIALFTIHMRFHNFSDPFTCNSCGQKCENKIEFTVHIFSRPH